MATKLSIADLDGMSWAGLILAAGSSRRMGTPKLLLPWGRTSIIGHLIRQCHSLRPAQVGMVIASQAIDLTRELDRLRFPAENRILNPAPERDMFGSLRCAARWGGWSPSVTHWLILLGDQPHLLTETLRQVIHFAAQNPQKICQPRQGLRWYHPVVLPKPILHELRSSSANTLREFLQGRERAGFDCRDPGLDKDIDTPEDYQKALAGISVKNNTATKAGPNPALEI